MLKKILIVLAAGILVAAGIGYYLWTKAKPDYSLEAPNVVITADSLYNAFSKNENDANKLYLSKVIQVSGTVSSISENQKNEKLVILQTADAMYGISCTMLKSHDKEIENLKSGDKTIIKGLCTGYLDDVVITNGSVVN